eukprot:7902568-Prorocentrum_lima.AAC.1
MCIRDRPCLRVLPDNQFMDIAECLGYDELFVSDFLNEHWIQPVDERRAERVQNYTMDGGS